MSADLGDLNRLIADLSAASVRATAKAQEVVRKTAHDVASTAQRFVPVDTGATRNSIGVDIVNGGFGAVVGPTTEYAVYLEYCTSKMAPHAFMGPAFDIHAPEFVKAIEELGGRIL